MFRVLLQMLQIDHVVKSVFEKEIKVSLCMKYEKLPWMISQASWRRETYYIAAWLQEAVWTYWRKSLCPAFPVGL